MDAEQLKEYSEFLKGTKGLSDCSIKHYKEKMRDFDVGKTSQEYCDQYIQQKKNSNQVRGAMLNFFQMVGLDRTFFLPPRKSGRKRVRLVRPVSDEDIDKVSKYLHSKEFRHGIMFDVMFEGALRRSETPTVKLNSFNWEEFLKDPTKPCQLKIIGKGDKQRIVLVSQKTAEKIFNHFAERTDCGGEEFIERLIKSEKFLFANKDQKPFSIIKVWNIIHKGSIEAIGRDIRLHELRHQRSLNLLKMGIPIHQVKSYLGHSSVATTEIYLHQEVEESIKSISEVLKNEKRK